MNTLMQELQEMVRNEWTIKAFLWLFSGVALAVFLLAIPKSAYVAGARKWRGFTPNFLTVGRLPFVYLGYVLFFYGEPVAFTGFMLVVFGTVVDRLDGKFATALEEAALSGVAGLPPGRTLLGMWLDPLVDKLAFIPLFIAFGWQGVLTWWLVVLTVVFELIGIAVRPPFNWLGRFMRSPAATGIGKIKAFLMCVSATFCIPYSMKWIFDDRPTAVNVVFGLAGLFAALSVLSRVSISRRVDEVTREVTSVFLHDD